jgi:hypothetical protein
MTIGTRNRVGAWLSYRPDRLHRLSESIPWLLKALKQPSIPLINSHSRFTPRIFEKNRDDPNGILRGPGNTESLNKTEVENLVSDSL